MAKDIILWIIQVVFLIGFLSIENYKGKQAGKREAFSDIKKTIQEAIKDDYDNVRK